MLVSTVDVSFCILLFRLDISCTSCMLLLRCVLMFVMSSGSSGVLSFIQMLGGVSVGDGMCSFQLCSACALSIKILWSECGPDSSVVAVAVSAYLSCGVLVSISSILHNVVTCPCGLWM